MELVKKVYRSSVARRIAESLLTLIGVSILTFIVLRAVPGDQITAAYGTAAGDLTPAQLQALETYYGINKPLVLQYFDWLGGILSGNLGISTTSHLSVASMTAQALPNTLELAVLAIVIGVVLGVPGGLVAANKPGKARDNLTQFGSLLALSVPSFLLATLLATWLANTFGWYPNGEGFKTLAENSGLNLEQMFLPALVLGISIAPPVLQTTRTAILAVRSEDFIRTARAKGVPERRLKI